VQAELKDPKRLWHAVALLQGVEERWGKTSAAGKAILLMEGIQEDPKKTALLAEQHAAEETRRITATARGLERIGQRRRAVEAWQQLVDLDPRAPAGQKAADEVKRLTAAIAATPKQPYLGLGFAGDSLTVAQVVGDSPAAKSGIKTGDVLLRLGSTRVASRAALLKVLAQHKPGEKLAIEVQRQGKNVELTVELGSRGAPGDE
jgi:membrane-associated protease RseP (regulator of RpoE activity)